MRPSKWMLLSITVVVIICAVKVYAANLSMTTYYPAPTGYYDSIKANKGLIIPCYKTLSAKPTAVGSIWLQSDDAACN